MPYNLCPRCKKLYPLGQQCPCAVARARQRKANRVRPTAWQRGYNAEYQRNRRWILSSDPLCSICGTAKATTVDHVLPLSKGGTNHIDNLRPACGPCNYRRGNRTA